MFMQDAAEMDDFGGRQIKEFFLLQATQYFNRKELLSFLCGFSYPILTAVKVERTHKVYLIKMNDDSTRMKESKKWTESIINKSLLR
ncbi:hypothetical protein SDC9_32596 [bioreactor metagenome]|uniref:Uncharacterized protein n=1 Tax=bioreactor metagenome TaxID=1076179 RepID=A0A644V742_9ZZZZ